MIAKYLKGMGGLVLLLILCGCQFGTPNGQGKRILLSRQPQNGRNLAHKPTFGWSSTGLRHFSDTQSYLP